MAKIHPDVNTLMAQGKAANRQVGWLPPPAPNEFKGQRTQQRTLIGGERERKTARFDHIKTVT